MAKPRKGRGETRREKRQDWGMLHTLFNHKSEHSQGRSGIRTRRVRVPTAAVFGVIISLPVALALSSPLHAMRLCKRNNNSNETCASELTDNLGKKCLWSDEHSLGGRFKKEFGKVVDEDRDSICPSIKCYGARVPLGAFFSVQWVSTPLLLTPESHPARPIAPGAPDV